MPSWINTNWMPLSRPRPDRSHLPIFSGATATRVAAPLLQRSLEKARKPFAKLELQIFGLSFITLLLAVVAAVFFARTVTQPLRVLGDAARQIERGDYSTPVHVTQADEIGQLGTALNQMRSAIGAREDQIIYQATHDSLTGLPNRTLFFDRVSQAIAFSKRSGESVGW